MSGTRDTQPLGLNFIAPFTLGGRTHSTLLAFMVLLKSEFATATQCKVPGSLRATLAMYKKTPRLTPEQHAFWKGIRSQLLAAAVLAQIKSHPEALIKRLFGDGKNAGMQFPGVSPNVPDAKFFAKALEQTWKALGDRLGAGRGRQPPKTAPAPPASPAPPAPPASGETKF